MVNFRREKAVKISMTILSLKDDDEIFEDEDEDEDDEEDSDESDDDDVDDLDETGSSAKKRTRWMRN